MLFGAGLVGLRSLASGIPAVDAPESAARDGRGARRRGGRRGAGDHQSAVRHLQHVVRRRPVNCNAPGTYDDPGIDHPSDPSMVSTPMTFGVADGQRGARSGRRSPASVLARTCFFHHGTYTIIHPDEVKVLGAHGASRRRRDAPLVSVARALHGARDGAPAAALAGRPTGPSRPSSTRGSRRPSSRRRRWRASSRSPRTASARPTWWRSATRRSIRSTPTRAARGIRRRRTSSTSTRRRSRSFARCSRACSSSLSAIKDNSQDSQIQAAIILFQMKVTPVVAVHVSFGGDNHGDTGLASEIAGHEIGRGEHREDDAGHRRRRTCRTR